MDVVFTEIEEVLFKVKRHNVRVTTEPVEPIAGHLWPSRGT